MNEANLNINKTALPDEASTWSDKEKVNWSELAKKYGITKRNGGQILKEFLAENGIQVAMKRENRVRRKLLKLPGGEISHPKHKTVEYQKGILKEMIENGELTTGTAIEEQEYTVFTVYSSTGSLEENKRKLYACHISLIDICRNTLETQRKLGIVRCAKTICSDEELQLYLNTIG